MTDFFDVIAPWYERLRTGARRTHRALVTAATFRPSDVLVDIGGGTGAVAKFFVGAVASVTVVDPSAKMLSRCRDHAGITCLQGTAERLPLETGSVDKVVMVDAFHHVPATVQAAAIAEIARVLKPDGTAVLVEFNPRTIGGALVAIFEKVLRMGSTFHAPQDLAGLFMGNGFAVRWSERGGAEYVLVAHKGYHGPNSRH